jgi:hypothetical protein
MVGGDRVRKDGEKHFESFLSIRMKVNELFLLTDSPRRNTPSPYGYSPIAAVAATREKEK